MSSDGLDKTLHVLTHTNNESAIGVLTAALTAADPATRCGAVRALLSRRDETSHLAVLKNWHDFDSAAKSVAAEFPGRLYDPIREYILSRNPDLTTVGCDAALWTAEYDLVPVLSAIAEDPTDPCAQIAADTLLPLADKLFDAANGPRDYQERRDPYKIRARVCSGLESDFSQRRHGRRQETIEAYLLTCDHDTPSLKRVLQNDSEHLHGDLLETLRTSRRPGVLKLLLDCLDGPHTPLSIVRTAAARQDREFLTALFARTVDGPSTNLARNLRRITAAEWIRTDLDWLETLDEATQRGAIRMLQTSGVPHEEFFRVAAHLAARGNAGGRRAAVSAMAEFSGASANRIVMAALDDEVPDVQAEALAQLRERRLPGALPQLIELLDSPHDVVRNQARACLPEYTFTRFLAAFDLLDEDVRQSTADLVCRVDPEAVPRLIKEFKADHRLRRHQALYVAQAMDVVRKVESHVIHLLTDRDSQVRIDAARALAPCDSAGVRAGLREALLDPNPDVRSAAEESICATLSDPLATPSTHEQQSPAVGLAPVALTPAGDPAHRASHEELT